MPLLLLDEFDGAPEVGVTGFDMGVDGFSGSSFLVDGVEALLDVPDRGLWGGWSFLLDNLSMPFSRGDVPFGGEVGSSEASSTTRS